MKEFLYWAGIAVFAAITGIIIGCYSLEVTGICI